MKTTTIVLLVLTLVAMLTVATPAVAEEDGSGDDETGPGCVGIHLSGPGVTVDPRCIEDKITALIT